MRIDLHTHSTASDGTLPPAELMAAAAAARLDVIALTDHDTTAGWDEAAAALPADVTLVPGAELSCVVPVADRRVSLHLLAYLFDRTEPVFAKARARLRDSRLHRARSIVDHMTADGLPITWDSVQALSDGASVGRPHIARALVQAGSAATVDEAFAQLLNSRSAYYLPKDDMDAFAAVRAIRGAGGVSVFAHPLARRRGPVVGDDEIVALAEAGLGGLAVDHTDHTPAERAPLRRLAADRPLVMTGSSDFHGSNKTVTLGTCTTDPAQYDALVAAASGSRPVTA